ncbi:MAG: methyltransferase domain-containing protein [Fimbriimonas sp.]|nr:methyltransferase domain-containing protein [Fimbriimonas sp.]
MNPDEYTKMFELEDHYWWFVGRRRLAIDLLKDHVTVTQPDVLDLGCGTGVVLHELAEWANPIGLDMSTLAMGYCRQRSLRKLIIGDGAKLPVASEQMDAIIGLDIFEHIEDDAAAFAEAYRVLRPGGILVMSVPAFRSLWGPHDIALMHFRRYRTKEVRKRLEEAGFVIKRASYSVFFLFPIIVVWRFFEKRKRGPAKASLVVLPKVMNDTLIALQNLEAAMISRFDLPWGSSVIAVAQRLPSDKVEPH